MSNSNTRWIALAAIAVSLVLLAPVVVGQAAPGAPTHGDTPLSTWADHAHEWMGGDATDHHAGGHHHGEQDHHPDGSQYGAGTHHADDAHHDQIEHDHTTATGHDHQAVVGNGIRVPGDGHHGVNSSVSQDTASERVDRRGSWGGCH
jgi:hypothetical protein